VTQKRNCRRRQGVNGCRTFPLTPLTVALPLAHFNGKILAHAEPVGYACPEGL